MKKSTVGDLFNRSVDRAMNKHFGANTSSWGSSSSSSSGGWGGQKQSPVSPVSSPLNKNAPTTPWSEKSGANSGASVIQQFDVSMFDK